MDYPRISIAGENALVAYFAEQASPEVSARVQQASRRLPALFGNLLVDCVPSYASLLVLYDSLRCDHLQAMALLRSVLALEHEAIAAAEGALVELPVYYSEESGPDLVALAERAGLSVEEVVAIHQEQEYRVYAIGFAPGFAYLGEVDPRIAAPRLPTPRKKVPRGAVAIADRQTAVYPAVSPGGWNLIGLCPQRMFDPAADPVMPVAVGDRVRFRAIDRQRFIELGGEL